jgi:hypothetical protein
VGSQVVHLFVFWIPAGGLVVEVGWVYQNCLEFLVRRLVVEASWGWPGVTRRQDIEA